MSLPIGRFVHTAPAPQPALALGRFVSASFKVRYVRTPAGEKRYGVPIGSPIPIGRRVKAKSGGGSGGSGSNPDSPSSPSTPSAPRRIPVPPAQRPAARRNFWGSDDNGASWDDDANELEVHDPARARAALDEALNDPSADDDQRKQTRNLRDSIGGDEPAGDAPEPDAPPEDAAGAEPASLDLPPDQRGVARRHFWGDGSNGATWHDDTNQLEVTDPDAAVAALDKTLADPSIDDEQREVTQDLRDRIAPSATPPAGAAPASEPEAPAEPDMSADRLTADYYRRMQESRAATIPQKRAVSDYVGPGYSEINNHLRNPRRSADAEANERWNAYMDSRTKPIDELFDQYQTPAPATVRRYVSANGIPDGAAPGRVVTLAGYASTSMADGPPPGFEDRDAVLNIKVPKGMPAVIPDGIGVGKPNEREMILPNNTRFRVESVSQRDGKTWIELTAIPPDPALPLPTP